MDVLFTAQPRYNERTLWICVGGSMLLHALVVWQVHGVKPAEAPPTQIRATIKPFVQPAPPAPAPAAIAAPEPPKPEPPKEAPPPEPPRPAAKPAAPEVKPLPKAADARPAPTAPPPPQAAPQTAPAAAAQPDAKAAPSTEAPKAAAAPASGAESADDKALVYGYQVQLAQAAQKYKRYPNEAMTQGWEGTATIRVRIGVDGRIAGIELLKSSGHEMLDEQARVTISKAKPFVPIPAGLRGKEFVADVRVEFSLKS